MKPCWPFRKQAFLSKFREKEVHELLVFYVIVYMSSNDFARFSRFSVENILTFNKSRSRFRGQKSNARTLNKKVGFDSPGKRRFVFSHNLFILCFVLCEERSRVITSAATRNCSLTSCSESVLSLRQSCKSGSDFSLSKCFGPMSGPHTDVFATTNTCVQLLLKQSSWLNFL